MTLSLWLSLFSLSHIQDQNCDVIVYGNGKDFDSNIMIADTAILLQVNDCVRLMLLRCVWLWVRCRGISACTRTCGIVYKVVFYMNNHNYYHTHRSPLSRNSPTCIWTKISYLIWWPLPALSRSNTRACSEYLA